MILVGILDNDDHGSMPGKHGKVTQACLGPLHPFANTGCRNVEKTSYHRNFFSIFDHPERSKN